MAEDPPTYRPQPQTQRHGTITSREVVLSARKPTEFPFAEPVAQTIVNLSAIAFQSLGLFAQAIPLQQKVREHYLTPQRPAHPKSLKANEDLAASYSDA